MSKINLITSPDILYNKSKSILLIHPSDQIKNDLQKILEESKETVNIYFYEVTQERPLDHDWLLQVHRIVDICIANLDDFDVDTRSIMSYLISYDHTYWLTKGENLLYNKISLNRIFEINQIKDKLTGGKLEI